MPARLNVIALSDEQYARLNKMAPERYSADRQVWIDTFIDSALTQAEMLRSVLGTYMNNPDFPEITAPKESESSQEVKFDLGRLEEIILENKKIQNEKNKVLISDYEFAVVDETIMFRETKMASDFWPDDAPVKLIQALMPILNRDKLDMEELTPNVFVLFPLEAIDYVMTDKEIIESLKFVGLRYVEIDGSEPSSA